MLSRAALVAELQAKGIGNLVPEEIKRIYGLLESEFVPLELCHKLAPLLEKLEGLTQPMSSASPVVDLALQQYSKSLQKV